MNIEQIEKTELHCHLDGLFFPEYLNRIPFKNEEIKNLISEYNSFHPIRNINEWFAQGEFKTKLVLAEHNISYECLKLYIEDLKKYNVKYFEIMLANLLFRFDDLDKTAELFQKYNDLNKLDNEIEINFLVGIGRTKNINKFTNQINRIIELFKLKLISGIAIAGDENACTIKEYHYLFKKMKDNNVNIEIHAGEWGPSENIWDAINFGFCKRIGHGLTIFDDKKLIEYLLKNDIHIEFCPTSNLILTNLDSVQNHPIQKAKEIGLNFSLNTDDPGDFLININKEYDLIKNTFDFTENDFKKIFKDARRAAFINN